MGSVKKSVVVKSAVKPVSDANAYAQSVFAQYAKTNGNATRVGTTVDGGKWKVFFNLKNGAAAVTSAVYLLLSAGKKRVEIPASEYIPALRKAGTAGTPECAAVEAMVRRYHLEKKPAKPFNNLKTLVNRLSASVRRGATLTFCPADMESYEALVAKK
jgi:hypothetical protein